MKGQLQFQESCSSKKNCFVGNNVRSELRLSISIKPQYFKLVIYFLEIYFKTLNRTKRSAKWKERMEGMGKLTETNARSKRPWNEARDNEKRMVAILSKKLTLIVA